jgi:hypothetical protein
MKPILDDYMERDLARFNERNPSSPTIETGLTRGLSKMREAVKAASRELQLVNPDQRTRDAMTIKLREAATADFLELVNQERATVDKQLNQQAESWTRDRQVNAAKYDEQVRKQALRFKALDADELKAEAAHFMEHPEPVDPETLDALSIELKSVDPEKHKEFRHFIRENKADEPWRHTDQGKRLASYQQALHHASQGDAAPIVHEDGSIHFESLAALVGNL